jgi:hypothetical protein
VNWFWQTRQATTQTLTWMPAPCANLTKQNWSNSLPFQQFQALLTLFSKSFASFLHSTCSLSVSNIYWALDEVYHPLCAPLPRNVTLRVHTVRAGLQMTDRTLTCSGNLFQGVCICAHAGIASCDHKSRLESLDFHAEPIPIHSPLLREYYLVSFPPLTYMLKFSRFSGLTSCLRIKNKTHWGGLITRNTTPEEDVQRCACPAPPRHMCQCSECYIETWKHENVKPEWHAPQRNKRHWSKHAFRNNPKEQYAFNFLLVHWILQFTMLITLRCTLHRCSSRDIHHWKLCCLYIWKPSTKMENIKIVKIIVKKVASEIADRNQQIHPPPLAMQRRRLNVMYMATTLRAQTWHWNVWMILPQVHLRKPCYDFSFL